MKFPVGAIVGVVEHGVEKVWPGIVTHVDAELHKVNKFSDAGVTILHDIEGVADLLAARDPKLAANNAHVIVSADELDDADDPAELDAPADELVDQADVKTPAKRTRAAAK